MRQRSQGHGWGQREKQMEKRQLRGSLSGGKRLGIGFIGDNNFFQLVPLVPFPVCMSVSHRSEAEVAFKSGRVQIF